jgi:hypothetical protein
MYIFIYILQYYIYKENRRIILNKEGQYYYFLSEEQERLIDRLSKLKPPVQVGEGDEKVPNDIVVK